MGVYGAVNETKSHYTFTILIPIFNGESILPRTLAQLSDLRSKTTTPFEFLFVDDGSRDESFPMLTAFCRDHHGARVIRLARNFGQFAALRAGFDNARTEIIVTTEMGLEHDPVELVRFYERMSPAWDMVSALRLGRQGPAYRRAASWLTNALVRIVSGYGLRDANSLLKAWRLWVGKLASGHASYAHYLRTLCEIRVLEVPVDFSMLEARDSTFSLGHLFRAFWDFLAGAALVRLRHRRAADDPVNAFYEIKEIVGAEHENAD